VTFERFTDGARRVLVMAQEEARSLQHGFIGTEHILLGLMDDGDSVAARVLAGFGATADRVRARVIDVVGVGHGQGGSGSPPFTPRAKKVLELSLREALQLHHQHIGTGHMLLGLLREGEGVAALVLVEMGLDLSTVRAEVINLLEVEPVPPSETRHGNLPTRAITRAGPASTWFVAGKVWTGVVVRAGRFPADYASAFDELVVLASDVGLDIHEADPGDIVVNSVETDAGPGIEVRVTLRLAGEDTPEA
jgi:Clp amino terminal domain, pathogenicity island component